MNFLSNPIDVSSILRRNENYIRFHNIKAKNLLEAQKNFQETLDILNLNIPQIEKRNLLAYKINGIGMKESSHFLRNIGFENLAILDRHILRMLLACGIYNEIPKLSSMKQYLKVEYDFLNFSKEINISMDELDLLFWSAATGEILK